MLAYVNGQYISADRPALPVNDRSFLYGDGLFETVRITNGQPFLWHEHLERLQRGAAFLKIPARFTSEEIEQATRHLLTQNDMPEGVVRIHLSRGASERGYGIRTANLPTVVITTHKSTHPGARELRLVTASNHVLADDPLTQHKTANRLTNILGRAQADAAGVDEAILLNNRGEIAEATAANFFVVRGVEVITPPLSSGALAGTTRAFVLKIAAAEGLRGVEQALQPSDLNNCDAVFLTSAHWLVTPAIELDGAQLPTNGNAAIKALRATCEKAAAGL